MTSHLGSVRREKGGNRANTGRDALDTEEWMVSFRMPQYLICLNHLVALKRTVNNYTNPAHVQFSAFKQKHCSSGVFIL